MDEDQAMEFSDLLQQAEKLTAEIDNTGELPRVDRNLRQILEAGQHLWSKTTQATSKEASDVKASILLGTQGYDLMKISNKLDNLTATKPLEASEPVEETDIYGFLTNEKENAILSIIDDCKNNTYKTTENLYWKTFFENWEQQKNRILYSMLASNNDVDVSLSIPEAVLTGSISLKTRSALNNIEIAYAKEISLYNDQVIQGSDLRYKLAERLYKMTQQLDEKNVSDIWEQIKFMIDVPHSSNPDILAGRSAPEMQMVYTRQAIKYLEHKYLQYIKALVEANAQQANHGGIPGTFYLIKSFLNIKMPLFPTGLQDGRIENHPIWALIYYCIRCGDLDAAHHVSTLGGSNLGEFSFYLKKYRDSEKRCLSPTDENHLKLVYGRSIVSSTDPYKKIVYSILGCCDLADNHSDIASKTEDYLWLRLSQIRSEETDNSQDKLTLSKFQSLLYEEYGEVHFNAYKQPFLYFKVLLLTAQFEAAIEFLARVEQLRCHAVHIAIVLYKLRLLALSSTANSNLLSCQETDKAPMKRLNLCRLIWLYTRKFQTTDPREAIQYFYILKDIKGSRGENLFVSSVTELVQETKEYEMLLGKMEEDGCRKPGLLDKFQEDTQKIIETVALDSETKGYSEEAIRLYDLASKHSRVLELLNKILMQVVSQIPTPGSDRERLETSSLKLAQRYRTIDLSSSRHISETFYLLLDLMTFFNQYHHQQYIQAMDTLQRLKIIPLAMEEVEKKVEAFSQYTEEIRCNMPDILLAAMTILHAQYKSLVTKGNTAPKLSFLSNEDGKNEKHVNYLRKRGQAIISFAGSIPYHLPGDTNSRLVQIQILMN